MRLLYRELWRAAARPLPGRLCAVLALALALAAPPAVQAQMGASSEEAVKAAYLYRLRHYVEWPPRPGQPLEARTVIGVVGADEVAEQLLEIPAIRDGKAGVAVRRLRVGDPLDGVRILFVGNSYWPRAGAMVEQAGARGILVVSESEGALGRGSMVNFQLVEERIRFEVSLDSVEQSGLKLSSQMLALATSVIREKRK